MRNLAYVGVLLLVLGVLAFVVPIPHRDDHDVRIGDTKIGIQTRVVKNYPLLSAWFCWRGVSSPWLSDCARLRSGAMPAASPL
jgi:hypothetical protein